MVDIDELAGRAVAVIGELARRAAGLATGLALVVGAVAVVTYLLGLAALQGSTRSAWAIVGAALVVIAAGGPLLAAVRLRRIRTHSTALYEDVRTLLTQNADAQQVVIETVEVQEEGAATSRSPVAMGQTAQFTRLRQVSSAAGSFRALPQTLRAMTTFPALIVIAILLLPVLAILSLVFLLTWVL
ncbi:MAG: hypothetical protein ACR2HP_11475 [Ilumatobacteraceae bacterium]